tara:strand:+ start:1180 stop:2226 length:1047 start_codon:yes stop_codon:yes gene_type:complete
MSKAAELAKMGEVLTNSQIGGRRNIIINGAMNVAQRATSETGLGASSKYSTVDRFNHAFDATAGRLTSSQVASGLNGFGNALKLDCTTADTSVAAGELFIIQQRIEGQDLQQLKKGTSDAEQVTLSFYAKVVGSSTDIVVELEDADNSRHVAKLFTLTTSWARYTYTFPADTTGALDDDNASSFLVNFWLHAGSTYNSGTLATSWASKTEANRAVGADSFFSSTDNELFLTGVQLEVGSTATPFEHRSFGEEKELCYRYYEEGDFSMRASGTVIRTGQSYIVAKRANATVNVYFDSSKATAGTINVGNSNNSGWAEGGAINYWNMEKNTGSNGDGVDYNCHWTADAEL